MPNRVLKDSITCSRSIDSLTWFGEVMFYRLIVKADDFGRYYADPQIIKSELFPRKEDLTKKAVADGLDALEKSGLIIRYQWDETDYLQIVKWKDHQQRRATKSKFPDSNGNHTLSDASKRDQLQSNDINCNQLQSNDINCNQLSPNTNTNTKTKTIYAHDPLADDSELVFIQKQHDALFEDAREIGLNLTDRNMKEIVRLYSEFGFDAVKHGLDEASRLNKISIAYIQKVCENYGNDKPEDELPDLSSFF